MNELNELLDRLIFFKQNDFVADVADGRISKEEQQAFNGLVIGVVRYIHDIRYHNNDKDCPCSPEHDIKLSYERIEDYIKGTKYALYTIPWKTIEKIISE